MTKENSPKKNGCTGCIGKLVLLLWIFIFGLVPGIWLGYNLYRAYPDLPIPVLPDQRTLAVIPGLSAIAIPRTATTSDGAQISVQETIWQDGYLGVTVSVRNAGNTPLDIEYREFYVKDGRNRFFEQSASAASQARLNPGISNVNRLAFKMPRDAKGLSLNYKDASLSIK
ncbi:MAG TPA: DUF4352 domain-containing protein [Chloroflexi bacterium]|nr:DUF4352 domain-containing protein [Chloroflexota bacterium]